MLQQEELAKKEATLNSSWFKTICLFMPGLVISFLIYVYLLTLFRSGILFPFESNFLLWFLVLLAHKDQIAQKHQRKIAAFIGLNFNLIVFLLHAMVGICDMNEDNPQIIFEPFVDDKKITCLDTNIWLYIVYGFI